MSAAFTAAELRDILSGWRIELKWAEEAVTRLRDEFTQAIEHREWCRKKVAECERDVAEAEEGR